MSLHELINYKYIVASVLYSVIGIIILLVSYWVIEKITPENLWKEIVHNNNIALAIVCASFMIAVAMIVSSAIHG
jgi:putative membrane protein